jgi:hypothetical protein
MRRQRRTTIIVVGGALAIASVGYGLGTQADDGTAIADNAADTSTDQDGRSPDRFGGPGFERRVPPGFAALAHKLGVGQSALARALRDFHEQHEADEHDQFASDLAEALGISKAKVQAALEKLDQRRDERFDRREPPGDLPRPPRDALPPGMPRPPHDGMRHFGMPLRGLASELGVTRGELRKALRELGRGAAGRFEQHQKELAQFLANRFDLDASKVADALDALRPPLMSPHRCEPPDHPMAL